MFYKVYRLDTMFKEKKKLIVKWPDCISFNVGDTMVIEEEDRGIFLAKVIEKGDAYLGPLLANNCKVVADVTSCLKHYYKSLDYKLKALLSDIQKLNDLIGIGTNYHEN